MRRANIFSMFGAGFCVLAALSCSGGGGGGTGVPSASTTPVTSSGTITKFGSVYINDREYLIDASTSTSVDGSAPVFDDGPAKSILRVGMVVTVKGTASGSSRKASTITHTDTLEGPQTKVQVDKHNGTLRILGQTVVVDDTTHFDDGPGGSMLKQLDDLVNDDVVEVSGFVKDSIKGVIVASFIEKTAFKKDCLAECEVKGIVKGHTPGTTIFQIGGLTVNLAAQADIKDMPDPKVTSWNDLFVEVKGTVLVGTTLTATKVEPEGFQAPEGSEVELEGFVSSLIGGTGTGHFMLGTTEVQAANAQYLGGTKPEVAVGQNLEVEGTISGNVITATKVKFQDSVRLEGIVESISSMALNTGTMTLKGLTLPNTITINWNKAATEFKGVTPLMGDRVKVRGREGATVNPIVNVIATEVDGSGPDTCTTTPPCDVSLQGAVQAISTPNQTVTILGVQINTSGFTDPTDFQGLNGQPIGRAAFFNAVNVGTLVQVKGRLTAVGITWGEVELED